MTPAKVQAEIEHLKNVRFAHADRARIILSGDPAALGNIVIASRLLNHAVEVTAKIEELEGGAK